MRVLLEEAGEAVPPPVSLVLAVEAQLVPHSQLAIHQLAIHQLAVAREVTHVAQAGVCVALEKNLKINKI